MTERRRSWVLLASILLLSVVLMRPGLSDAAGRTYQSWQITNGQFSVPSVAGGVVTIAAMTVSRAAPWIAAIQIGYEVGRFIINKADGTSVAVETAAQAAAEAAANPYNMSSPPSTYYEWKSPNGQLDQVGRAVEDAMAFNCAAPRFSGIYPVVVDVVQVDANKYTHSCQRSDGSSKQTGQQVFRYATCWSPTSWANLETGPAPTCTTSPPSELKGGTTAWSPTQTADPSTGAATTGWHAPSNSDYITTATPADTYTFAPTANGTPTVTVTPNADGGYTVQSFQPEAPTVVNGVSTPNWTIQTTTINNAGAVTNTYVTINNTTGPPPVNTGGGTSPPVVGPSDNPNTPPPTDCGSLSCESTQVQVKQNTSDMLTELRGTGAPTMPDQTAIVNQAKTDDTAARNSMVTAITSAQDADKSIFPSWVWTPPSGSCTPIQGSVHGYAISIDVCPWVDKFRELIGWLFALFGAFQIYGYIYRPQGASA